MNKILFSVCIMASMFFSGCKPKDADIKASVEEKLRTNADITGAAAVSVNDGVATISGECKDNACVAKSEELAKSVKGVKSVVNNFTVTAPAVAAAPVEIATDTTLSRGVMDALKDHPGVKASINDGVVTLTGELKRAQLQKLMMTLNTLKPKKLRIKSPLNNYYMALQEKYKQLTDAASTEGISNLQVREQNSVLYIDGEAPSGAAKDKLWEIYNQIDPDYRAGDLVLNIDVAAGAGTKATVATDSSNLNIRKGPGTDQPIVGKAAHNSSVTLLSKTNDQWWLIKTDKGEEGYAYAQYLSPQ